jgi:catechol 2,3-dioxygenase-like lactoylglutathione lyase family enzyme
VLGRFLEQSIVTPDIQASHDFYCKLGFSPAAVGEAWTHPYAVLTDGRVCVGLHQESAFQPSITFVKSGLLKLIDQLGPLGLEFEFRRLANDVFNEIGWLDPAGHLIRVVEARTFSPGERRTTETSLCGYFTEIALPAAAMDAAKNHWEHLGFVGLDDADGLLPHVTCTSDTIDVGLYDPAHLREPMLMFEIDDLDAALVRLEAAGLAPSRRLPAPLKQIPAALLTAPEGTALLLTARPE